MVEKVEFELVSPERLLFSKPVGMVVVPGAEGDFGVLRGHAPMISGVRIGVIDVYDELGGAVIDRIFVSGGFAEVTGERCTVLAETGMRVAEIDRAAVEVEIKSIRDHLAVADNDARRVALAAQLEIAEAKLAASA
jgi:F-type H+-transporting ATPase subunit epsilon